VWRRETEEKGRKAEVLGIGLFVTFKSETILQRKAY
jgi:hypothetical protein